MELCLGVVTEVPGYFLRGQLSRWGTGRRGREIILELPPEAGWPEAPDFSKSRAGAAGGAEGAFSLSSQVCLRLRLLSFIISSDGGCVLGRKGMEAKVVSLENI